FQHVLKNTAVKVNKWRIIRQDRRSVPDKSKVPVEVAPRTVDVIGRVAGRVGLDIEELDDEGWSLHTISVRLARLVVLTGKGELHLVEARLLEAIQFVDGDVCRHSAGVILDELVEDLLLLLGHLRCGQSSRWTDAREGDTLFDLRKLLCLPCNLLLLL